MYQDVPGGDKPRRSFIPAALQPLAALVRAFHTHGCKVTETNTIYYCDNIEVGRHEMFPLSKRQPLSFMVNLATGGGWPVDLSRYSGPADMYIDYVRVYKHEHWPTGQLPTPLERTR
jgi:hypothetical protein